MADATDERHRYGQHYTPREVAKLLAGFAVRAERDLIFDPSCGDGRLLAEALRLKDKLSPTSKRAGRALEVYGADRSASAIELAASTGARVAVADFFDIAPGAELNQSVVLPAAFDAIIGNPPYIRQELMGREDKQRIRNRLEIDCVTSPDVCRTRWSGRSDIYVYFFAHAIGFLKRNGRLVFLTASSWLDVGYGARLREFLLANFRVIAVIESASESFFEDASINTAITVLERESDAAGRQANTVRFVQLTKPLAKILDGDAGDSTTTLRSAVEFARSIESTRVSALSDTHRIRLISQADLSTTDDRRRQTGQSSSGWGKFLRADEVFFRVIERGGGNLRRLSEFARVRFGVKTGANEFFYVTKRGRRAKGKGQRAKSKGQRAKGEEHGAKSEEQGAKRKEHRGYLLALAEVAMVRRGITTGANDFFYLNHDPTANPHPLSPNPYPPTPAIESRYLSPVIFSLKEIPGIVLERAHTGRLFFNCEASRDDLAGTNALEYIKHGERAGFHIRPTCASRDPWYAAARGMRPAPLIFPSKVGERWVVALNRAKFFEDKKLYGIFPARGVSELTLAALLNSTWARYYAEVTCRQMTGAQAIADIDVMVAGQVMIPDPRDLSSAMKKKLEAALLALARRPVYSVFEEIERADRRRLDALTLEAVGFSDGSEREAVLDELYAAVTELVRARLSKSRCQ